MKNIIPWILIGSCVALAATDEALAQNASRNPTSDTIPSSLMTFFVTSEPIGNGGNLGGLAGADAHCQSLAAAVGAGGKTWRAYLSTQARPGQPAVNARDRIGNGPWYNSKEKLPDYLGRRLDRPIIKSEIHGDTLDEARRGEARRANAGIARWRRAQAGGGRVGDFDSSVGRCGSQCA